MKAIVSKSGFDLSPLREHGVERVIFASDGYSVNLDLSILQEEIEKLLENFSPAEDVIVPTGGAIINFVLGFMVGRKFGSVRILIYQDKHYQEFHLDENSERTYAVPS
jgi:hypothetical protein